jgi:hypothetical protein
MDMYGAIIGGADGALAGDSVDSECVILLLPNEIAAMILAHLTRHRERAAARAVCRLWRILLPETDVRQYATVDEVMLTVLEYLDHRTADAMRAFVDTIDAVTDGNTRAWKYTLYVKFCEQCVEIGACSGCGSDGIKFTLCRCRTTTKLCGGIRMPYTVDAGEFTVAHASFEPLRTPCSDRGLLFKLALAARDFARNRQSGVENGVRSADLASDCSQTHRDILCKFMALCHVNLPAKISRLDLCDTGSRQARPSGGHKCAEGQSGLWGMARGGRNGWVMYSPDYSE